MPSPLLSDMIHLSNINNLDWNACIFCWLEHARVWIFWVRNWLQILPSFIILKFSYVEFPFGYSVCTAFIIFGVFICCVCIWLQILPQLLYYFGVKNDPDSLDWATIVLYTCEASCEGIASYKEELAWVQLSASNMWEIQFAIFVDLALGNSGHW